MAIAASELGAPALAAAGGLATFFVEIVSIVIAFAKRLFLGRYGRRHRLFGVAELTWLTIGAMQVVLNAASSVRTRAVSTKGDLVPPVAYDVILGILGTCLTLSAANDFKVAHEAVKNVASGALEETSTVSYAEMMEHSFYQLLNLVQIIFLHLMANVQWRPYRAILAVLATSPWLVRSYYPVNRFSDNYVKEGTDARSLVGVLYRLKKYQYLFYKHCLLHGLNLSVALSESIASSGTELVHTFQFRFYWLGLNTAYVMEFFLQTLVKRRYISQQRMLRLNMFLMLVTTIPGIHVLWYHVSPVAASISLLLNFFHRHHELANFGIVLGIMLGGQWFINLLAETR